MPWCPKCRFEYRAEVKRCADCGTELVEELPPEPGLPYGTGEGFEQVFLGTVFGETHAALLGQALEAEGIQYRTQLGGIPDFAYPGRIPTLPIGIFVNRRDLARATEIFQVFEQEQGELEA